MSETVTTRCVSHYKSVDFDSSPVPYSYGLLRAALTEHLVNAGFIDEAFCIRQEKALLRAVARATGKVWTPSQGSVEDYLKRYAEAHQVRIEPVYVEKEPKPKPAPKKADKKQSFAYRWLRFRDKIVAQRGDRCEECQADGVMIDRSMHVDHIIPRAEAPDRIFDPDNVRVLCPSCHSKKTVNDTSKRKAPLCSIVAENIHA